MLEERLRAIPFLRGLPAPDISAIAGQFGSVDVEAGSVLFKAGEASDAVYVLDDGWLRVEAPDSGTELAELGPGSVVGEMGLILDAPRTATVRATSACRLWRLARTDVDALIAEHPHVGVALGREVGLRLLRSDGRRLARPPRIVVVAAPGAVGLAAAIADEGVDPVAVLALDDEARTTADLPPGVAAVDREGADPTSIVELASKPAGEVTVVIVALPEDPSPAAIAAVDVADHAVDLVAPLPAWAAARVDPLRRLQAPRRQEDLRRLARWVGGRSVGLALSSGGSKTVAHIGVVRVLREAGIPIDALAGTSGGSIAAAGVAYGWDHETMVARVRELPDAFRYRRLGPRIPPRDGLFSGASLRSMYDRWWGGADLGDAEVPLFVVAADITNGEEVVIRRGPAADAIRASMGIPGVFAPVALEGRWLTDGGIVTPLPTRVLRDAGVGVVLASNVAGQDPAVPVGDGPPRLVETLGRIVSTMERQVLSAQVALADAVVRPVLQAASSFDFRDIDGYLAEGERAAEEALPLVLAAVGKRTG